MELIFQSIKLVFKFSMLQKLKNINFVTILAAVFLILMAVAAIFSIQNDTITNDEVVHISAGYSYITKFDYRMNPEHPPLIKILAATPLLFTKIKFPETSAWQNADQWSWGDEFLFKSDNNADLIILLSRLPIILLMIILGIYIFLWGRELLGEKIALLVVGLYSFSPNIIAHGRLVTTDLGITCFGFITLYYFWRFLSLKNNKSLYLFYLFFSLSLLVKFSAPVIVIILISVLTVYLLRYWGSWAKLKKELILGLRILFIAGFLGILAIFIVYLPLTSHMPYDVILKFIDTNIKYGFLVIPESVFVPVLKFMGQNLFLKPLAWYFMGMAMVFAHSVGGHTTYFWGQIGNGWWYYFPVIFNIKTTIPVLIGFYSALFLLIVKFIKFLSKNKFGNVFKNYFNELYLLVPVGIFFLLGAKSRLNLGVRYILPIYPFVFLLGGFFIYYLIQKYTKFPGRVINYVMIILVLWQFLCFILIFPHYLGFFNGFIGGADKGYRYAVDSNLDWGQDLKRLKIYMDEHQIDKVYLSYFGRGSPEYYKINYETLYPDSEGKVRGLVAISATNLQGAAVFENGNWRPLFSWLKKYSLVDKIGYSIFLYHLP